MHLFPGAAQKFVIIPAMHINLAEIERRLQGLVEGTAARLFAGNRQKPDLLQQLLAAMRSGTHRGEAGEALAPNLYTLYLSAERADAWSKDPTLLESLGRGLEESGHKEGLAFSSPPVVRIEIDPDLQAHEARLLARDSLDGLPLTSNYILGPVEAAGALPGGAFLIVNGVDVYPLDQAVINLGRRPDNHIVLDDPRISRLHAQLRLVRGRFVVFDLDSTGGTWVNGVRIQQAALTPGDVLSLAGLPLVFGQDQERLDHTQDMLPDRLGKSPGPGSEGQER